MIIVNEYFEGNVKSLGYMSAYSKSSIGVIESGEYKFGTAQHETMTVIEGALNALLPGELDWKLINGSKYLRTDCDSDGRLNFLAVA